MSIKLSYELLVERFLAPVVPGLPEHGTTYDLECHPSERAMGDIASAADYLRRLSTCGRLCQSGRFHL